MHAAMQGMSDLAAPILYVVRDEADAFWCFAALMERMQVNFQTDGNGMHAQLQVQSVWHGALLQ